MDLPKNVIGDIEAIFFDMNGTLRMRQKSETSQPAARRRILELLGKAEAPEAFWEKLDRRKKAYSQWAQENLLQLSEADVWSTWILPEFPRRFIEGVATELTLAWSERRGCPVPNAGAEGALIELNRRGYHLGIISNSLSTVDIPRSLDVYGWKDYFEVVILSSTLGRRKPAPEPFLEAARQTGVDVSHCAYLGNRIEKDIGGCKQAGFAVGIILDPSNNVPPLEPNPTLHLMSSSIRWAN